jgi:hypothetical protein
MLCGFPKQARIRPCSDGSPTVFGATETRLESGCLAASGSFLQRPAGSREQGAGSRGRPRFSQQQTASTRKQRSASDSRKGENSKRESCFVARNAEKVTYLTCSDEGSVERLATKPLHLSVPATTGRAILISGWIGRLFAPVRFRASHFSRRLHRCDGNEGSGKSVWSDDNGPANDLTIAAFWQPAIATRCRSSPR